MPYFWYVCILFNKHLLRIYHVPITICNKQTLRLPLHVLSAKERVAVC